MTLALSIVPASASQARLGFTHGYRLDGDVVHLNAEVQFLAPSSAAGQDWALQLWACAPSFNGGPLTGIRVAELALGALDGLDPVIVSGTAAALPPAEPGEHAMVLALVAGGGANFDVVHDMAIYPEYQIFQQPRFRGDVAVAVSGNAAELTAEAIENPRPSDNLSGTLVLELWSLDAPYQSGRWSGSPVASVVLGTLGGQCEWTDCRYEANAALPAAPGHLTLMLREWGPGAYVTRDFRAVAGPRSDAAVPESAISAAASGAAAASLTAASAGEALAKTSKPRAKKATAMPAKVSLNQASEAELAAIKGISIGLARAIIAGRPYATLDDVCRAKGMGRKLLAKVEKQLTL